MYRVSVVICVINTFAVIGDINISRKYFFFVIFYVYFIVNYEEFSLFSKYFFEISEVEKRI